MLSYRRPGIEGATTRRAKGCYPLTSSEPNQVILFIMVDGVGIGSRDPGINPLARETTLLSHFLDGGGVALPRGGRVAAADATLGVPGRPQSATGHTTLLSGINAARHLGRHLLGFPNAELRQLLERRNLFLALAAREKKGTYANAYRAAYLEALDLPHQRPRLEEPPLPLPLRALRPAASTVAFGTLAHPFRTFDHLREGEALYHDITSDLARRAGCEVPRRSPPEAAELLLDLARRHDLTFFEHFRTDEVGHAQDFEGAREVLASLDEFLRRLVEGLREGEGLLVTSDHGNLEDLSHRRHTQNPVPVLGFGRAAPRAAAIDSILGVYPALVALA